MSVDKVIGGVFALIAVYLIVFNSQHVAKVFGGFEKFSTPTIKALQGR